MRHRRKRATRTKARRQTRKNKNRRRRNAGGSTRGTTMSAHPQSEAFNRRSYWNAYRQLAIRAIRAMKRLRSDVQRNANPATLIRDRNNVLLTLAECNYMARECTRLSVQQNRRRHSY